MRKKAYTCGSTVHTLKPSIEQPPLKPELKAYLQLIYSCHKTVVLESNQLPISPQVLELL